MDWSGSERDRWRSFQNSVLNHRFPYIVGELQSVQRTRDLTRSAQPHGVSYRTIAMHAFVTWFCSFVE
jgi:hypothetical protein